VAFYVSEIGPLNQVVHMWEFDSLAHLERCRAAIAADPASARHLAATDGIDSCPRGPHCPAREAGDLHAPSGRYGKWGDT
jgi:NIPSNAP